MINQIVKNQNKSYGSRLPLCVDGVQWYSRNVEINGVTSNEYKNGVDGAITNTAPTGTIISDGYCTINNRPGVDSIPPSTTMTFNPFIYGSITLLLLGGNADITADGNTVTFPDGRSGTRSADADLDDTITITTDATCTILVTYVR